MKKIIAYKRYFSDFISTLSQEECGKIKRALDLFKVEDRMPRHYIKFIRDGLYEFRVSYGNNEFRIFFIYDGEVIVVLFNAFRKKMLMHGLMKVLARKVLLNEKKTERGHGRNTMPKYCLMHEKMLG